MKRVALLSILLATFIVILNAQENNLVWKFARTSSTADISMMETDSVGNTYIAGIFTTDLFEAGSYNAPGITGNESSNAFLLKLNPLGHPVWLHSVYGDVPGAAIEPVKMSVSDRGEMAVILTAKNSSTVTLDDKFITTDPDMESPAMCKISKTGQVRWFYDFKCQRDSFPAIQANDLFIDELGDVYAIGSFIGESASLDDMTAPGLTNDIMMFLTKVNAAGNVEWFRNCPYDASGDNGHLQGLIIENTDEDFFYIGGVHSGSRAFYFGTDTIGSSIGTDAYLAKFNKSGDALWAVHFMGDSIDVPEDIKLVNNQEVVMLGFSNSYNLYISGDIHTNFSNNYNIFLARYSPDKLYRNSTTIDTEIPYLKSQKPDAVMNTDRLGNITICSEFYSPEVFVDGTPLINPSPGTSEVMVAKISSNTFNPYWTYQASAPGDNFLEGASIDRKGNIYLGGTTYSNLTINPEDIPYNTDGVPYLAKISPDGSLNFAYWQLNSGDSQIAIRKITSDGAGNCYVGGYFYGNSSAIDVIDLTGSGIEGLFFGKYAYTRNLHGTVVNTQGMPFSDGYVKIYGYTIFQESPLNDSVRIAVDGTFELEDIPMGNYLMVAVPDENIDGEYIPTYYPDDEYWEFAERIRIDQEFNQQDYIITIQRRSEFVGTAEASGNVSAEDELKSAVDYGWEKPRPVKKSSVVLAGNYTGKSTYQIVATTLTDNEGNFVFTGIEDGFYYLWVDIPGLPCEPVHVVNITGGQYVGNINYLANEEVVVAVGDPSYTGIAELTDESGVKIYPNPAIEKVTISIENLDRGKLDIYDLDGRHLNSYALERALTDINVSTLREGTYIFRIMTDKIIGFKKITVSR